MQLYLIGIFVISNVVLGIGALWARSREYLRMDLISGVPLRVMLPPGYMYLLDVFAGLSVCHLQDVLHDDQDIWSICVCQTLSQEYLCTLRKSVNVSAGHCLRSHCECYGSLLVHKP